MTAHRTADDVADAVFDAIERGDIDMLTSLWADDIEVWHSNDGSPSSFLFATDRSPGSTSTSTRPTSLLHSPPDRPEIRLRQTSRFVIGWPMS